jgi:CheY-like chemotaxis protein
MVCLARECVMETPHMLVADDDPDIRELMELILRRAGLK